jgi:hypothetical protein
LPCRGGSDLWPLKPKQLFPYIDMDQCLDLWTKFQELKKKGVTTKEIAVTIGRPSLVRHLIANVACTGLKVAETLNIGDITRGDQTELVKNLIDILYEMTPDDPLCESGTNRIHTPQQIDDIINKTDWQETDEEKRKSIGTLNVDLVTLTWALYWPYFPSIGYETYGPYPVGHRGTLLVKDYYHLKPKLIWPEAVKIPFEHITLYQIFDTRDVQLTFSNRIVSQTNLFQTDSFYAGVVDGKTVTDPKTVEAIAEQMATEAKNQTARVNDLTDVEKVKKGAQLSYYSLKEFYEKYFGHWFPEAIVDKTINKLGTTFIDSGREQKDRTKEEAAAIFDPRISMPRTGLVE